MKRICAITMARNDEFFLNRWISYYGAELGEENLYIYLDGVDQPIPACAGKTNIIHQERVIEHVVIAEKRRLAFLSEVAKNLLKSYDIVIGVDADEFLLVDPSTGKRLANYLSSISINSSVSGLGLDVGQHMGIESELDVYKLFLEQRNFAYLSSRYTKPSVINKPVKWGSGFHRIRAKNFHIDPNLYLFHFGSVDYEMIMQRFQDKDRMATGRKKHIEKRVRTITIISKYKPFKWGFIIKFARVFQTIVRPLFAWNKPSIAFLNIVVQIPSKFKSIV